MHTLAPGSRAVIRDEEWLIRRVDTTVDGQLLTCDGISDLVRGQSRLFLTALEGEAAVEVLDPARTEFVADTSPAYAATRLYLEGLRRTSVPNDAHIHLGHRGVMNLVPYQLDPALQALRQPRARILIADAVGLGKTLEAGVLTTELIQRGRGKRILVVTQKSMLTQFQKEWWSRFSIPLVRLDSVGLNRVRNRIPANHNPFNYYDRTIISVDTLKTNLEYKTYLENAWWDIIVIDECHNVAARAGDLGLSRRARLARLLATRSDSLILLSATPHDGSARSFASLMALLDPTAISDPDDYTPDDFRSKGLVIRRFKKDIRDQVAADFQERETTSLRRAASPDEERAYAALLDIRFTQAGEHHPGRPQELQRVGMQKALFSSPAAALQSTRSRISLLAARTEPTAHETIEIEGLRAFERTLTPLVDDARAAAYSKYRRLIEFLRTEEHPWDPAVPDDRLVIFSERLETLAWLSAQMRRDCGLSERQVAMLHGQLSDIEQQDLVDRFGRLDDPLRLLLCSDVASEGLNLHYFCHRLVHFDLPWSLMVFQQRNGRVDRYGQKRRPHIVYLFTEAADERIRGDMRILEILQAKDEQAYKNLGDPSAFLNVYDIEKEAAKVGDFMAEKLSAAEVEAKLDAAAAAPAAEANEADYLLELFGGESAEPRPDARISIAEPASLFPDDYTFARTALTQINQAYKGQPVCQWEHDDATRTLSITAPHDLRERLRQLPREAQRDHDRYVLCADAGRMAEEIERARQARSEDDTWPRIDYLWPQHPVMSWLGDRVITQFGRHKAPLVTSDRIDRDEQVFLMMGLIPNRRGQPLLVEWQAVCRRGDGVLRLEPFEHFVQRAGLHADERLPNREMPHVEQTRAMLASALPTAVEHMRAHMVVRQQTFDADLRSRLHGTLAELEQLQQRQLALLDESLVKQIEGVRVGRRKKRADEIARVFDQYRTWIEDTLNTEPHAWIQVLAAVVGRG